MAQRQAIGALNLASSSDFERLELRLRSFASRLEAIEDSIDRSSRRPGRAQGARRQRLRSGARAPEGRRQAPPRHAFPSRSELPRALSRSSAGPPSCPATTRAHAQLMPPLAAAAANAAELRSSAAAPPIASVPPSRTSTERTVPVAGSPAACDEGLREPGIGLEELPAREGDCRLRRPARNRWRRGCDPGSRPAFERDA